MLNLQTSIWKIESQIRRHLVLLQQFVWNSSQVFKIKCVNAKDNSNNFYSQSLTFIHLTDSIAILKSNREHAISWNQLNQQWGFI